jgi:thioredoxin-like negative regulator of GroEL
MTRYERIEACLDALTNYVDDPNGYPEDYLRKAVIDILAAAGVESMENELAEARRQLEALKARQFKPYPYGPMPGPFGWEVKS